MLPRFACNEIPVAPEITKTSAGEDVTYLGAFPCGSEVTFTARVPRRLGAAAIVMRIHRDIGAPGEESLDRAERDFAFRFFSTNGDEDVYKLSLDTAALCGQTASGLFYYEFLFLRGADTLFSDCIDNVHFHLRRYSAGKFRLLIYEKEFKTPDWLGGGIMYQIFPDRFCRGEGPVSYREDSVFEPDWENGMPQYARHRGESVENNLFFGGNLWGVIEKIPYLASLGVNILYFNPIFSARSNHKYDTSDYMHVDDGFGGDEALKALLAAAHKAGMRVILDGVFNHTGNDSVFFDALGRYGKPASDPTSPYHSWYWFREPKTPQDVGYESWWGIPILPKLKLSDPACQKYFVGKNGVIEKYTAAGVDGWRLDVADELPDEFLDKLRARANGVRPQTAVIGEVWENAVDKIAYEHRRRYFRGKQLDSVMNYPLRTALISFAREKNAAALATTLTELYGTYPPQVSNALMNIVGTHDTERILSILGDKNAAQVAATENDNERLAARRLNVLQYKEGVALLKVVSALQFTVFGFPCVYYGDELGMEGMGDPFCRMPMRWHAPNEELLAHYRRMGAIRRSEAVFDGGSFCIVKAEGGYIEFIRSKNGETVRVAANVSDERRTCSLHGAWTDLYTGAAGEGDILLLPNGFAIIKE